MICLSDLLQSLVAALPPTAVTVLQVIGVGPLLLVGFAVIRLFEREDRR